MTYGFVRVDPETNDEYLASIPDDDTWKPIILRAHEQLLALDPGYQIAQIKSKFGGLRFYYDTSDGSGFRADMDDVIGQAERDAEAIEQAARKARRRS